MFSKTVLKIYQQKLKVEGELKESSYPSEDYLLI